VGLRASGMQGESPPRTIAWLFSAASHPVLALFGLVAVRGSPFTPGCRLAGARDRRLLVLGCFG